MAIRLDRRPCSKVSGALWVAISALSRSMTGLRLGKLKPEQRWAKAVIIRAKAEGLKPQRG